VAIGNFELDVSLGSGANKDKISLTLRMAQTAYLKAEPKWA
jgi:hypothetical protein